MDLRQVRPKQLVLALSRSSAGMIGLIELGITRGGRVPRATWQNFPTDLAHFLSYFAAHEAHHRGQLVMVARQLGHRLPRPVAAGVWQWTRLAREQRLKPAIVAKAPQGVLTKGSSMSLLAPRVMTRCTAFR